MDRADSHGVTIDPVPGEVDLRLDRGPGTDGEHAGDRREGVQVDTLPDLRPESSRVGVDPRGSGKTRGTHDRRDLLGQPEPQVHRPTARVRARGDAGEQHPCPQNRNRHFSHRGDEQNDGEDDDPPGKCWREGGTREAEQIVRDREVGEPSEPAQYVQRDTEKSLRDATAARGGQNGARGARLRRQPRVEFVGERADSRVVVDVGDTRVGVALADGGDELCRTQ